jgi:ferredoxin
VAGATGCPADPTACTHTVHVLQTGEIYACSSAETLLQALARTGKKGIPVGCLNGGCGICKVVVRSGSVRKTGAMSRAHVSQDEEAQGVALACRIAPVGPVNIEVIGKLKKAVTGTAWGAIASE